jgi:hypothetical protein
MLAISPPNFAARRNRRSEAASPLPPSKLSRPKHGASSGQDTLSAYVSRCNQPIHLTPIPQRRSCSNQFTPLAYRLSRSEAVGGRRCFDARPMYTQFVPRRPAPLNTSSRRGCPIYAKAYVRNVTNRFKVPSQPVGCRTRLKSMHGLPQFNFILHFAATACRHSTPSVAAGSSHPP